MTAKKWLVAFGLTLLLLVGALCAFNALVDPFGIFGDPMLNWYSYDMTQNPRASKIAYIDQHHEEFDSYIIGCSSSSSFPTEALNNHYNARFYNMIMYGADLQDVEQEAAYLIENYTCKNLVVSLYIDNALHYNVEQNPYTYSMHAKADGSNTLAYYLRYLLAKPTYAIDKLTSLANDTYLKQSFDAFNPTDGTYDKKTRDVEPISDLESYLADFSGFTCYPVTTPTLSHIEDAVGSITRIKALCEENGIQLTVVMVPVYWEYFDDFKQEEVTAFYKALAEVTDFWDFSMSSISYDPRYFYDETHFRNDAGQMAIARMFGDTDTYIPADFGRLVTAETVDARMEEIYAFEAPNTESYTTRLPILIYHHLDPEADGTNDMIITPETFRLQMETLKKAGYTAVTITDLQAYTNKGTELPENPILITFDDGYESNYEYAYPILKELGMKATIFAVGSTWGKNTYKETGKAIYPHFTTVQAKEMIESGVMDIQSHTYDLHQAASYEIGEVYENVLKKENEREEAYIARLTTDHERISTLFEQELGYTPIALAFPHGSNDELSNTVLGQIGVKVTFTTEAGVNTLIKGLPQSLMNLRRLTVTEATTPEQLLQMIQ